MTSLGICPTCGRPTPAKYLTPLRARMAWRSTSVRTRASTSTGFAITAIGLSFPLRLVQLPGKVPNAPVQVANLRAQPGNVIGCGQVDQVKAAGAHRAQAAREM